MNWISLVLVLLAMTAACTRTETASSGGTGKSTSTDPAVLSLLPQNPTVLDDLHAVISSGGRVSYRWERNGSVLTAQTGAVLPQGQFARGERISVAVTIEGREAVASVVIANSLPTIRSVAAGPQTLHRGVDLTVSPEGYDADGDNISYSYVWTVNGQEYEEHAPVLSGSAFRKGDRISLTIVPSDSDGDGEPYQVAPFVIPNGAPRMQSLALVETKGAVSRYRAAAEDPDGDPLTYAITAPPPGMTMDPRTGMITWTHSREAEGTHAVEVTATDTGGSSTHQTFSLSLSMPEEVR